MERKEKEGKGKGEIMGGSEIWKVETHRRLERDRVEKGKKEGN